MGKETLVVEKLATIKEFYQEGVKAGAINTPLAQLKEEFKAVDWVAETNLKAALEAKWRKEALAEVIELKEFQEALFKALEAPAQKLEYALI